MKIANAFSIGMLKDLPALILVEEISEFEVKLFRLESFVGHESTAKILSHRLEKEIEVNRSSLELKPKETIIVAQLMGERKEFKELSEKEIKNYEIKFFAVRRVQ